jgi:Sigma-70, region 4
VTPPSYAAGLDAGPEQHALDRELPGRLRVLLDQLPDTQREILVLRIGVGLSPAETGAIIGVTSEAVRVAQHRALRLLRFGVLARPGTGTDRQVCADDGGPVIRVGPSRARSGRWPSRDRSGEPSCNGVAAPRQQLPSTATAVRVHPKRTTPVMLLRESPPTSRGETWAGTRSTTARRPEATRAAAAEDGA